MSYPEFFAQVPTIRLRDPLAAFLGAATDGVIEYGYVDAVKLAGHSCPTVASAYAMTRRALQALYGEDLAERGAIRVQLRDAAGHGVTGVIANVVALLTGAAGETGFKGLAGQFDRRALLAFAADVPLQLRLRRTDSGAAVDVAANLADVAGDPRLPGLLQACLSGEAGADERRLFGELWQDRVRRILLEHGDDPEVFALRRVAN
jgi:hypothetical protein